MREIVVATDSRHDPVGNPGPVAVGESSRPQYAELPGLDLGQPYRPYTLHDVRFDDAQRIGTIIERADIHRHVRPARSRNALDDGRGAGIPVDEKNIATMEQGGKGARIGHGTGNAPLERLGEVHARARQASGHGRARVARARMPATAVPFGCPARESARIDRTASRGCEAGFDLRRTERGPSCSRPCARRKPRQLMETVPATLAARPRQVLVKRWAIGSPFGRPTASGLGEHRRLLRRPDPRRRRRHRVHERAVSVMA